MLASVRARFVVGMCCVEAVDAAVQHGSSWHDATIAALQIVHCRNEPRADFLLL
jgi:hypothetical protein